MRNLTMMTDLYQLTMMQGYFCEGMHEREAVFDLFFRRHENITYALAAGLEQVVEYIGNIRFDEEDIAYLRSTGIFREDFLAYLREFKFRGDLYAVPEGTVIYPSEPILTVRASLAEAQFVETAILNIVNHATLIATKASRIVEAAGKSAIVEFGLRRAQGPDAGIYGARACVIGGCKGTSNVLSAQRFGIEPKGTHAHSWVMSFDSELEAFRAYARHYPDDCLLLVDTYDTLHSGIPNAIRVFDELRAAGHEPVGIRLDSGDLAYLSKQARKMLDDAGYPNAMIFGGGDVDEHVLAALSAQGARIDAYGVGTRMITSADMPALGGVYKLAAIEEHGILAPRMKFSDSEVKITNPGLKDLYRLYDGAGKAIADLIALRGEEIAKPLTLTHPIERWKTTIVEDYTLRKLHAVIFDRGELVYDLPKLEEIAAYARREKESFWEEYRRLVNPHIYKVDLSDGLYELKSELLGRNRARKAKQGNV